jgi:quinohemoprotein ethanol dehydrogenase
VLVGYGGSSGAVSALMNVGWKYGKQPRLLLTFGLDGKAAIPKSPPATMAVHPVDNPAVQIKQADVEAGRGMFNRCGACHGMNLVSSGAPAPDLLESQVALDPEALWAVVHDGALLSRGMPRYEMMMREQVMQIYAYIRAGAREVLAQQKKAGANVDRARKAPR